MDTLHAIDSSIEIQLNHGQVALIDAVDVDLAAVKWRCLLVRGKAYARTSKITGALSETILLHRVILERVMGRPLGRTEYVDHCDGNRLNNCRSNLRLASRSQNGANCQARSNNTSGYKGVYFNKGHNRWHAHIKVNQKEFHLGYFPTAKEAHDAYCKAATEHFGEFAKFK